MCINESTDKNKEIPKVAKQLGLKPYPEGGWYTRTWKSEYVTDIKGKDIKLASLAYFYLDKGESSIWYRTTFDMILLWHGPSSLTIELGGDKKDPIEPKTKEYSSEKDLFISSFTLDGKNRSQLVIPSGIWRRTQPVKDGVLCSCVSVPDFHFEDFEKFYSCIPKLS
jgi:predicted cupin superfamily sugar epimerase